MNPVDINLAERLINMEHIIYTKFSQRLQNPQYIYFSYNGNLRKVPGGGIGIPEEEIVERIIVSISNFNSSKFPHESFTGKHVPSPYNSDLVCTRKNQNVRG